MDNSAYFPKGKKWILGIVGIIQLRFPINSLGNGPSDNQIYSLLQDICQEIRNFSNLLTLKFSLYTPAAVLPAVPTPSILRTQIEMISNLPFSQESQSIVT